MTYENSIKEKNVDPIESSMEADAKVVIAELGKEDNLLETNTINSRQAGRTKAVKVICKIH